MTTVYVIAAVVIGFIACGVTIVVLIEQRDRVTKHWADEAFRGVGLKHRLTTVTADFDALLARHAELATEHAQCPVPVVPTQRTGGHDDLPVADVDVPVHTDVPDDVWLELLITRPADGATS